MNFTVRYLTLHIVSHGKYQNRSPPNSLAATLYIFTDLERYFACKDKTHKDL